MDAQDSPSTPLHSDLSAENSSDSDLSAAPKSECRAVLRASFLWRVLHWPIWLFCRTWIRVRLHGQDSIDNSRGGLFLVNHQSFLDPLLAAVLLNRPVSFLARDNLFRIPIVGWILRHIHVIPISREAARGGSIRIATERLEAGFLVGIFPEGTRSSSNDVRSFRPGFLAIARRTSQPIYPVGVAGSARIMPRGAWWILPGRVEVVYGAPLSVEEVHQLRTSRDDAALCELARSRVAECAAKAVELLKESS